MSVLNSYHELERVQLPQGAIYIKPGMRGYPDPPPAERVFRRAFPSAIGSFVDATGTAGAVALAAVAAMGEQAGATVKVLEPSMAALRGARQSLGALGEARAGLPWDLLPASVDTLALAPPADRGNARVAAELHTARLALGPEGTLYLALHKEQGARRFEKLLKALFDSAEVIERDRGWRLSRADGPLPLAQEELWIEFEAAGLQLRSLPGVHAAGRLDPGSSLLVERVPWPELEGRRVLDLGCGVGVLGLLAAQHGGEVTAVDDDLAAVESVRQNAARIGLTLDVRHSDVDSALTDGKFDFILCNPPFHVGRGVRLDVPRAFIAAAGMLLEPGGELWLVANRELPYEREIAAWSTPRPIADERGFKVLSARR